MNAYTVARVAARYGADLFEMARTSSVSRVLARALRATMSQQCSYPQEIDRQDEAWKIADITRTCLVPRHGLPSRSHGVFFASRDAQSRVRPPSANAKDSAQAGPSDYTIVV